MPVRNDLLNILANWFTICGAICLTMYESILSNPVDFFNLLVSKGRVSVMVEPK